MAMKRTFVIDARGADEEAIVRLEQTVARLGMWVCREQMVIQEGALADPQKQDLGAQLQALRAEVGELHQAFRAYIQARGGSWR